MWVSEEQKQESLKALREGLNEIYAEHQAPITEEELIELAKFELMSDFKERLTEEHLSLTTRTSKLENFIMGDDFKTLPPVQRSLLKVQLYAMKTYNQCLIERISLL